MNNWVDDFFDLKHRVIEFIRSTEANGFSFTISPTILSNVSFLSSCATIVFKFDTFSLKSGNRYGICLFEHNGSDYIFIVDDADFTGRSYRVYGLADASLLGLDGLWSFLFSSYELSWLSRDNLLEVSKVYKEKKKLDLVIPAISVNCAGVIKI